MAGIDPPDRGGPPAPARVEAGDAGARTAEARAAELLAWFDTMVDTSPTAMGVISALEGRYVRANQPMCDLLGMTRDELLAIDPVSNQRRRITHTASWDYAPALSPDERSIYHHGLEGGKFMICRAGR